MTGIRSDLVHALRHAFAATAPEGGANVAEAIAEFNKAPIKQAEVIGRLRA